MKTLCIYHGPGCTDGFAAAWAVRSAFGVSNVDFRYAAYGSEPPYDIASGRDVLIVDFSYPRTALDALAGRSRSVTVLDHHKTAQADLVGLPISTRWISIEKLSALFDMDRSGAGITWDFLLGRVSPRPQLIDYVEDYDLWRFALPHSRAINAAIKSYPDEFEAFDALASEIDDEEGFRTLRTEGEAILRARAKDVEDAVRATVRWIRIGGVSVPVANVPGSMASDAGHLMATRYGNAPFVATYHDSDGWRRVSLRSVEGGADVSEIAKRYRGGGHAHASGFSAPAGWEGDAP